MILTPAETNYPSPASYYKEWRGEGGEGWGAKVVIIKVMLDPMGKYLMARQVNRSILFNLRFQKK